MSVGIRLVRSVSVLCAALLGGASQVGQAQQGAITGAVTDAATGEPLEAARVLLVGPNRIEGTGRDGQYTFRGVPPGSYQVRVLRVGYRPATDTTAVAPAQTASLNFALAPAPIQLDEIVTTATGQQSKLEIGNSISTIDASKVAEEAPITEFGSLLTGRAAGVQVLKSSGATGTGTKIRIRGSNSVSLSNEPLYYIDGVRMDATSDGYAYNIGGQSTSRINDLNPDDIENIEIVKGPSAATLYGIQAANGVVLITTRKGAAGRARWNAFVEQGVVEDPNTYRTNFFGRSDDPDFDPLTGDPSGCTLLSVAQADCVQSRVEAYNPLNDEVQRPLKGGHRQQYGVNVAGGSEAATYYVSAEYEGEVGVYKLRGLDFDSVNAATPGGVPAEQHRPNQLDKLSLRANATAKVAANADLQLSLGYLTSKLNLPENDNTLNSVIGSGDGSGVPQDINRGWFLIPAEIYSERNRQGIGRFTGGLTANWRPLGWLTTRATFGYDVTNRQDTQFWPTGQLNPFAYPTQNEGELNVTRAQTSQLSVDLLTAASYQVSSAWSGRTAVGGQYFRNLNTNSFAQGRGLARGTEAIFGAATTDASDDYIESRSAGGFVDQQMSFRNRLFLTAGLRLDDNSAFGKNFDTKPLPKLSASWLALDDQSAGFLNTLRLRAAYGQSTQQPGSIDAQRFYAQAAVRKDVTSSSGVSLANLGNADLKPELSQEIETGFDAGLFNSRVSFEATFFYKQTRDALIEREIVPSLGTTSTQFFNLGQVSNKGIELRLDTRIIDNPDFAWDLTLSGSFTDNNLDDLGEGVEPITLGFIQRHVEGFPLGGIWDRPILSFSDANGNNIIEPGEYVVGDDPVFRGPAIPTREFGLRTGLSFFRNLFSVAGLFDYRGGHWIENGTDSFRCGGGIVYCRALIDPTAPLEDQANASAYAYGDPNGFTEWGFFEPAWFIKLRELSFTINAPDHIARAIGAGRASLTLSGRNLLTIDDYSGIDPEVNGFGQGREGGSNFAATDFFSQPQVRYWVARVNLGF
ncbi:MAG TPA: SusC/RagA family TonB-linked outer membrane protein [Gemmatimonadales bacterium]|nr:SusC/RagA family TonB-linked outer membrane protein [Gemmatimonadales bacterium]